MITKNWRKIIQQIFFSFFGQKLQFPVLKLQKKHLALKKEHPALQKMKFINFLLCLWVIFPLLDPDPDPGTPLNPDPQHCPKVLHHSGPQNCVRQTSQDLRYYYASPHRCPEQHSWASSCCSGRRCAAPSRSRSRWIRRRRQSSPPPPPYACCCSPAAPNVTH
jgi:hypothetical protein